MEVHLYREGTGSNYTREQHGLFGELDPAPVCFLQLVGKRYPLKAARILERKEGEAEEEGNDSIQTEPNWKHKALSGTNSVLCARYKSTLWEAPEEGAYQPKERL